MDAGKRFAAISGRELRELLPKLEAIARKRKDGAQAHKSADVSEVQFSKVTIVPYFIRKDQMPS